VAIPTVKVSVGVWGAEMRVFHVTSPPSVGSAKPSSGRLLVSFALNRRGSAEGLVVIMDDVLGKWWFELKIRVEIVAIAFAYIDVSSYLENVRLRSYIL
jgi:hypothetical protein